jgi:hypothetical protein
MFADTAIVDYHLPFAGQGKQMSVFRFCMQQANISFPFPFSVCSKQTEVFRFNFMFAANKQKSTFSVTSAFCL